MLGIALLVAALDVATANNTLAIVVAAPVARDISREFDVPPKTAASLMDTCSCIMQGVIPYGGQLLIAGSIAGISSLAIIPCLFYPFLLTTFVALTILSGDRKH